MTAERQFCVVVGISHVIVEVSHVCVVTELHRIVTVCKFYLCRHGLKSSYVVDSC